MNFDLTEEHLMIRDAARDFAQNELLSGVIERDEKQEFPTDQVKKMAELGFMGMMVSPEYGGGGMDTISYVLAMEEISKVDASSSVIMSVNNSLVCWGLETYGSQEQKDKYLKRLATGEIIGAFCLSEPEAGSDATSQRTTAIDNGDHYILNGTKNVLFGTQAIFSEGISIDNLSCLILGTPINNEPLLTQLIGRVIRKKDKKLNPVIVDIHLLGNTAKRQASNRVGYYMKQGWEMKYI